MASFSQDLVNVPQGLVWLGVLEVPLLFLRQVLCPALVSLPELPTRGFQSRPAMRWALCWAFWSWEWIAICSSHLSCHLALVMERRSRCGVAASCSWRFFPRRPHAAAACRMARCWSGSAWLAEDAVHPAVVCHPFRWVAVVQGAGSRAVHLGLCRQRGSRGPAALGSVPLVRGVRWCWMACRFWVSASVQCVLGRCSTGR